MKKLLVCLMVMLMLYTCAALAEPAAETLTEGTFVTFGTYAQNADGQDKTPIRWVVMKVDADNDRVMLMSLYGLDCVQYDTHSTSTVRWVNSSLSYWLNSDFLNTAFTAEEQVQIVSTDLYGEASEAVTLLDRDEFNALDRNANVKQYLHECAPTDYAVAQGVYIKSGLTAWWLRAMSVSNRGVCWVGASTGKMYYTGSAVTINDTAVRPVIWVSVSYFEGSN